MKITKTKSGSYTTLIHIYDAEGKRHAKRFTRKLKDEVRIAANDYLNQHKVYIESMVFSDALKRFLERSERVLSPSTLRSYKAMERTFIEKYGGFCGLSCDRISSNDLQSLVDLMQSCKKKPKTIRNYLGLVSAVLSSEGFRMPSYSAPQVTVPRFNIPDKEIITKMAKACTGQYKRMELPLALAVLGLRRGEICGVTADALDGDVLHIKAVHVLGDDGLEHVKEVPKTEQSIRPVLLPHAVADEIRKRGRAWDGSLGSLSDAWPHLCKVAGVEPFRLHDCRHFFVSYCHDVLKLSDSEIMRLGGWKTDNVMKRRYRHAITDHSDQVAASIGGLLT